VNILNKQSLTEDKGQSSSLGVGSACYEILIAHRSWRDLVSTVVILRLSVQLVASEKGLRSRELLNGEVVLMHLYVLMFHPRNLPSDYSQPSPSDL
jgi:hypothetical protein